MHVQRDLIGLLERLYVHVKLIQSIDLLNWPSEAPARIGLTEDYDNAVNSRKGKTQNFRLLFEL